MVMRSVISVYMLQACDCGDTQITGSTPVIIDGTQTNTVVPDTEELMSGSRCLLCYLQFLISAFIFVSVNVNVQE